MYRISPKNLLLALYIFSMWTVIKKSQQGEFAGIYMKKRNFFIITMEVYTYDKSN